MRAVVPKALAEREDTVIKDAVLSQLETLGFTRAEVINAVQKNVHNNVTASYYLLYGKHLRALRERGGKSGTHPSQPASTTPRGAAFPPQQPRAPGAGAPSPATKTVGSAGAIANTKSAAISDPTAAVDAPGTHSPSLSESSSTRRHSTQPSHYKESAARAATPLGASPRHTQQHQQHHHPPGQPAAPSPYDQQSRRPSSVRTSRNLVLLTNGGMHQPASTTTHAPHAPTHSSGSGVSNGLGVVPVPPRTRRPPGLITSSGASAAGAHPTSRVSVSNGMVALTPLIHHPQQHHQHRRESSGSPATHINSRRHTLEISQHAVASPRGSGATSVRATAAAVKADGESVASSSIAARRRITMHPGTSLALESTQTIAKAAGSGGAHPHSSHATPPTHGAVVIKEDDARQPQSTSAVRIQATTTSSSDHSHHHHHPQPPPARPSPPHLPGVM